MTEPEPSANTIAMWDVPDQPGMVRLKVSWRAHRDALPEIIELLRKHHEAEKEARGHRKRDTGENVQS